MKILGVDPGTQCTGWGMIEAAGSEYRLVEADRIAIPHTLPIAEKLNKIFQDLSAVIGKHQPDILALENIFYSKNIRSMLRIGEARACAMLAASSRGVSVIEYPPANVKQAVTGNGRASKVQIQAMVKRLLGLNAEPPADVSDALALAICHFHQRKTNLFRRAILQRQPDASVTQH